MPLPIVESTPSKTTPRDRLRFAVADAWQVPPFISAAEWVPHNVQMPPGMETSGGWDRDLVPYSHAVLEAYSDPNVSVILLPWAARLSKTITSIACMMHGVTNLKLPAITLSPDMPSANELIGSKYYPMLESCEATAKRVKPKRERNIQRGVELIDGRIRRGYAGSTSSTASNPAALIHITEASKCGAVGRGQKDSAKTEGHAVYRVMQRATLFPFDKKIIIEGTPSKKGSCVMTGEVHSSATQRRHLYVPCPHCGEYQRLQWSPDFGHHATAGVKWDKLADGKSDPLLAEQTAWYDCVNGCKIENRHRREMLRGCVWIAEGQTINKRGEPQGEPLVKSSTISFGETLKSGIGTVYSLLIKGWGQLAKEWLEAVGSGQVQSFINEKLGLVYDPQPRKVEASDLQKRLASDVPLAWCPSWTKFLTWWSDVGAMGDTLIFFWYVYAWGEHGRGALIDYDIAYGEKELGQHLVEMSYPITGQPPELRIRPAKSGIDSGDETLEVYRIVDGMPGFIVTKGSSLAAGKMIDIFEWGYRKAGRSQKDTARRRKHHRGDLLYINTHLTQKWIEDRLTGTVLPTAANGLTFPAEVCDPNNTEHAKLFDELLAEYLDGDKWERTGDNEARDGARGNRTLAELHVLGSKKKWDDPPNSLTAIATPRTSRQTPRAPTDGDQTSGSFIRDINIRSGSFVRR